MDNISQLAVVTGASSGIGYELAHLFARNGFDLVINAEDSLEEATGKLQAEGVWVEPVQADLRSYDGVEKLYDAIEATGQPVAAAALNAGVGQGGAFIDNDLADEQSIIDLNITSTVHLAKRLLPDMVDRGEGRVLITSSIASTTPGSFQAVYNASKSFLQSFAEAVRNELAGTGVTITSLMPGPTDTEFFGRAQMLDTRMGSGPKDDPAEVARQGFEAMMAGKAKVASASVLMKLGSTMNAFVPDVVKAQLHRVMAAPGSSSN